MFLQRFSLRITRERRHGIENPQDFGHLPVHRNLQELSLVDRVEWGDERVDLPRPAQPGFMFAAEVVKAWSDADCQEYIFLSFCEDNHISVPMIAICDSYRTK